ncbi:hypothetical protein BCS42_06010 [Crenothrix sp. D3]|nr:hypothetical protein BCS42_06010 [Crenothrix sp. D3]
MQIYLTSYHAEADLCDLIQETLAKQQLQADFNVEVLASESAEPQKIFDPATATLVTVLIFAVRAGGAITEGMKKDGAITHLAKALEALVNRKVEVKLKHNDTLVELSGSAGHIEKMLKTILK